jgi:catechol 2,3-dioxygenase-like lactoylglutathione lyase family enzyme
MVMSIDHIVITTSNIKNIIFFYTTILEMKLKKNMIGSDKSIRYSLHFGENKINIHETNNVFLPHAHFNRPGSLDICFISNKKMNYWTNKLKNYKINVLEGPVERLGAIKTLISIYFRDPDLNLIEISNYKGHND